MKFLLWSLIDRKMKQKMLKFFSAVSKINFGMSFLYQTIYSAGIEIHEIIEDQKEIKIADMQITNVSKKLSKRMNGLKLESHFFNVNN